MKLFKMKAVAVILSTYNGEKYIVDQLASLGNQTYPELAVYIHDDGSTDKTIQLIEHFINEYKGIVKFYMVNNKGGLKYPACFIDTLKIVEGYDYYAFCDQDDVWNCDKIEKGVLALNRENESLPLLYYTAVDYYDENLNFVRHSRFASRVKNVDTLNFQNFLLGGEPLGMTYIFNNKVRDCIIELYNEGYKSFKDGFIKILCASAGKVIYDVNPSAKYRRHSDATTGIDNPSNMILRYYRAATKLFTDQEDLDEWRLVLRVISSKYGENIHEENRELFELFKGERTFKTQWKKVFWKRRFRNRIIDEIGYRLLFVTGKL